MHLDNGQEAVPALIDTALRKTDKKYSYYRDHSHALASGVDPGKSQLHALHSLHQLNTYFTSPMHLRFTHFISYGRALHERWRNVSGRWRVHAHLCKAKSC